MTALRPEQTIPEREYLGNPVRTSAAVQLDAIRAAVRDEVTRAVTPLRSDATAVHSLVTLEVCGDDTWAVAVSGEVIGTVRHMRAWRTWATQPAWCTDPGEHHSRQSAALHLVHAWATREDHP